jgi:HK97 family phage major capsid protein
LFHRDALKQIRKLRNDAGGAGTGDYLWQPSTQVGQPDTLLGVGVMSSEYVPNTFTSGLYVGMVADFSYY